MSPRGRCIALALVLILALGLRLHGIARQSLWFDEAATVHIVSQPIGRMIELIKTDERTPPLHYFLMWGLIRVFGNSETSLRLPSALAGTAAVGMLYLLVRRLLNWETAIIAALLMALSHYQIEYSQETRAYSLMLFLALWSCELFTRLMEKPTPRREAAYVLVTAAMLYAHLYGAFAILAQHLAFLFWSPLPLWERVRVRGNRADSVGEITLSGVGTATPSPPPSPTRGEGGWLSAKRWLLLNVAVLALFGPWIPTTLTWTRYVNSSFWTPPMTWSHIAEIYRLYSGSLVLLIVLPLLAAAGVGKKWNRGAMTLLISLALLPVFVPAIAAALTRPTFTDRYAIFVPAALFALAAAGIVSIPFRWVRMLAVVVVPVLVFVGRPPVLEKADWRGITQYVLANMRPTDVVAINRKNNTYLLDYYIHHPGFRPRGFDSAALPFTLPLPADQHVWLILSNDQLTAEEMVARGNWGVISTRSFGKIKVLELADQTSTPTSATRPTTRSP